MILYWAWMALLAVVFYAWPLPSSHLVVWGLIGASSAAAVLVGVVRNRPRSRAPWLLLALALAAFAAGDTTYNVLTSVAHEVDPFPSYADLFYGVTCVAQVAGMFGLVHASTAVRDRSALIDSVVLTCGVGVMYWIFVIGPRVHQTDLSNIEKIVSIAYPLSDVLVLALVARLVVSARRSPAVRLLAVGTGGLLFADVVYGLSQLHANWEIGGPVDIGWIILYAAWGAAALCPSMATLTEPRATVAAQMSRTRMVVLAISSLVAPATLLIAAGRGHTADVFMIAALSAAVFLLIMVRLSDVLASNRLSLERERALRRASDTMVSVADIDGVRTAVRGAIASIVGSGTPFYIDLVDHVTRPGGTAVPPDGSWGARMRYTSDLGSDLPTAFRDYELALVSPLNNRRRPAPGALPTAVVMTADEATLSVMKGPIEVLTAQATLALDRIALTEEVNRRKSEEYFRTLVHNTSDVILIVDRSLTVAYASPSAATVFGDQPVVGAHVQDLLAVADGEPGDVSGLLGLKPASGQSGEERTDLMVRRRDGATVCVETSTRDLTADPTVRGFVVTLRDVTDQRRLERDLTHHAFHDSLTGVANRRLFQERVTTAVAGARQHGGTVGVLFIDLDDFKIVNDTMGHHAGDKLLTSVVDRLSAVLPGEDSLARLGGDEFAALVERVDDPVQIEAIAEAVIDQLGKPFLVGDVLVNSGASVGVATSDEADDTQELLRQADLALYVAKGSGKGQWRRYQHRLHTAVLERMQTRTELDQAVQDEAFELRFQPIVSLKDSRPVGFEALLRWNHPRLGEVQPGDFVDIAEESGLIVPLGDWVLRNSIKAAASWSDESAYVSVNVSVRQFRTPGFVDAVRSHLSAFDLPAGRLMLEITESLLLPDEPQVLDDLSALRVMGVRIAIDDFGTGYSSLSYLRKMPIDVVKVDRSFVETIGSSGQQRALVEGIVWLAATLGLDVIAEGIETETARDLLFEIGCPYGQGYFFAAPMSQEASVEWRSAAAVANGHAA